MCFCTSRYDAVCQINCVIVCVFAPSGILLYVKYTEFVFVLDGNLPYVRYNICVCTYRYVALCQINCVFLYLLVCCVMSDILCFCLYVTVCCVLLDTLFEIIYLPVCNGISAIKFVKFCGMSATLCVCVITCPYVAVRQIHSLCMSYMPVSCLISDTICVFLYLLLCCNMSVCVSVRASILLYSRYTVCVSVPAGKLQYIKYTVCVCVYLPECCV